MGSPGPPRSSKIAIEFGRLHVESKAGYEIQQTLFAPLAGRFNAHAKVTKTVRSSRPARSNSPGTAPVFGAWSQKLRKKGSLVLRIWPSHKQLRALESGLRLTVEITISFVPRRGGPSVRRRESVVVAPR